MSISAVAQTQATPEPTKPPEQLNRTAFTVTSYNLDVKVEPAEHRLEVRGKIALRNDSEKPQSAPVLQISSTLRWAAIKDNDGPLEFTQRKLDSDIDHTGALTEAVVTLRSPVQPNGTIELDIGYSGTVTLDATRLRRMGAPAEVAEHSDWDRISADFTAVRGIGYVAWYPIATQPASLQEGNTVFEEIAKWKARHSASTLRLSSSEGTLRLAGPGRNETIDAAGARNYTSTGPLGFTSPVLIDTTYQSSGDPKSNLVINHFNDEATAAHDYSVVAESAYQLSSLWFVQATRPQIDSLPEDADATYDAGPVLFTPLKTTDRKSAEVLLVHTLTHAAFYSPRVWMYEGAAHFAQALMREGQDGRKASIQYMAEKRNGLALAEPEPEKIKADPHIGQSLVLCYDEVYYRTKALYVWWMLRDIVGDEALRAAIVKYRPEDDKQPAYFQKLLEAESKKDLEWFFDDWVYRDRGLPEFKVTEAYGRESLRSAFLVTATIENTGMAAAEVPVIVNTAAGDVLSRLKVPAHGKAIARIEVGTQPVSVTVNDGSVPETDPTDNFAIVRFSNDNTIPINPR